VKVEGEFAALEANLVNMRKALDAARARLAADREV
jgi:hypothetical protein